MINTVLKLSFVFVRSFGQFLVWFNWSDFCCFDLVVQLNNIASIKLMDTTITDFMYSCTGGQVSLFLSMNKNYSCYVTFP